jgi:hypothetical protein
VGRPRRERQRRAARATVIIRWWRCDFDYECTPDRPHGCSASCGWEFAGLRCDAPGCDAMIDDRAAPGARPWFFKKNGQCWCPGHIPAWVPGWRARQEDVRSRPDSLEQGPTDVDDC